MRKFSILEYSSVLILRYHIAFLLFLLYPVCNKAIPRSIQCDYNWSWLYERHCFIISEWFIEWLVILLTEIIPFMLFIFYELPLCNNLFSVFVSILTVLQVGHLSVTAWFICDFFLEMLEIFCVACSFLGLCIWEIWSISLNIWDSWVEVCDFQV